MRTTTGSGSYE